MKKIVLLLNLLALFITAFAQSPYGFHYQAIVQNDSLRILANTAVEVRTSILTETNYIVYREVQSATTDEFGLLSIEVGIGTTEVGAFSTIPWGSEPFFLQSEITPVEGGGDPIVITERIMSVPYAFFANETEQDFSGNYNDLTNKPNLFDGNYYLTTNDVATMNGAGLWKYLLHNPSFSAGRCVPRARQLCVCPALPYIRGAPVR